MILRYVGIAFMQFGLLLSTGCSSGTAAMTSSSGSGSGSGSGSSVAGSSGGMAPSGGPGCGLASAAFCDTFDRPATTRGRAGELDPAAWSGGRMAPQAPTYAGNAFPVGMATLPTCRADLAARVFPDDDTLICDPNDGVGSNHLLVAVAAQNYGMNSYRIRQPFDFAGRTGKIVFDAEGYTPQLLGWVSLEVTEDPIAVPSYDSRMNDEGGILPKNGFELQFSYACATSPPSQFSLSALHVFEGYADTVVPADWQSPTPAPCVAVEQGKLNHFEVLVSEQSIEVYASPASADGVAFDAPVRMLRQSIALPFSRGYVHISTHNHATIKYSPGNAMDAWIARWDNVGFDGPVLPRAREYEIPDALVASPATEGAKNIGYQVPDAAMGPAQVLRFEGVDIDGVKSARIALSAWYPDANEQIVLRYRLNGKAWRDRGLTADEITAWHAPVIVGRDPGGSQGALGQILDVPLSDLVAGRNTLELVTQGVEGGYPVGVANIDMILDMILDTR